MPHVDAAFAVAVCVPSVALGHLDAEPDVPVSNCCNRWADAFRPLSRTAVHRGRDAVSGIRMADPLGPHSWRHLRS